MGEAYTGTDWVYFPVAAECWGDGEEEKPTFSCYRRKLKIGSGKCCPCRTVFNHTCWIKIFNKHLIGVCLFYCAQCVKLKTQRF